MCVCVGRCITLATIWVVRVAFVTFLALANVTRPIDGVDTRAISLAYIVLPLLSFITWVFLNPNCPIKNHWNIFQAIKLLKSFIGEFELAFFNNEGVAAGVKAPYIQMVVVACQFHGAIFHPTGDVRLAASNAGARVLIHAA